LDANESVWGDTVLVVTFPARETELTQFEWVEEGKPSREWLIPSTYIKANARVTRMPRDPNTL
jgi:hypothetical protein